MIILIIVVVICLPEKVRAVDHTVHEKEHVFQVEYIDEGKLCTESFNTSVEKCVLECKTEEYSPKLAHLLISLCNSVHDKETLERTFISMHFEDYTTDYEMEDPLLAYGIAKKELSDGTTLVLVVTRGTENSIKEIISNFDAKTLRGNRHEGFDEAAYSLSKRLSEFIGTDDHSNIRFVFTGHSRGAAVINLLTVDLMDSGVLRENIVAYNFACPDVAIIEKEKALSYKNIYNIGNVNDTVTWFPGVIFGNSDENDIGWNKYGQSYWFSNNWNDPKAVKGKLPQGTFRSLPMTVAYLTDDMIERLSTDHSQVRYLDYLRNEYDLDHYKDRDAADMVIENAQIKTEDEDSAIYSVVMSLFL